VSDSAVARFRVTPRSSRDAIEGADEVGEIRIWVTAPPADGAANKAVLRLVAKTLRVPRGAVTLVSGAGSRHKRLRIEGVDTASVLARWPGAQVMDG
jgi:uncharacterized protein (TIGR00251 family)